MNFNRQQRSLANCSPRVIPPTLTAESSVSPRTMKTKSNHILTLTCAALFACLGAQRAAAAVSITGAAGGTTISADNAATGGSGVWTTLGTITIAEGANADFGITASATLVLRAPAGFEFNTAVTPSIAFTAGRNITNATIAMTDASNMTITLGVANNNASDTLTIGSTTGVQVRPTAGTPLASGNRIYRPTTGGGTATINGITTSTDGSSGANFGNLTEVAGAAAAIRVETTATGSGTVVPSQNITAGNTLTVYAIARDQFGNFVTNATASAWSLPTITGGVVSGDLVPAGNSKSATFTGRLVGTATVRADSGSLTATDSGTLTVLSAAANKMAFTTTAQNITAGSNSTTITVQIQDVGGNPTNATSARTVNLTKTGTTGVFRDVTDTTTITSISIPIGSSSASFIYRDTVIGSPTLTAASTGLTSGTQVETIVAGPASMVRVETLASGAGTVVAAQSVTAGNTVTGYSIARDAYTNFVSNIAADSWSLPTKTSGVVDGDLVPAGDNKSVVFTGHGTGTGVIRASSGSLTSFNSGTLTVVAGSASKLLVLLPGETAAPGTATGKSGTPNTQAAGTGYSITVNSVDSQWNPVTSTHTMAITTSDSNDVLPANAALVAGTRAFSLTNKTAGSWTVTATDISGGAYTPYTTAAITMNPGAFTKLQILAPGETASPGSTTGKTGSTTAQTAGNAFNITVRSVDANWNLVNSVSDMVAITSSDANAVLPANDALSSGVQTFSVTLKSGGSRTVTATDASDGAKTANTSAAITVNSGAFAKLQVLMPGETAAAGSATGKTGTPTAQTAGTGFSITVNSVDANWNLVSTNNTVHITSSDASATLPANNTLSSGTRSFSVTNKISGLQNFTAANVTNPGITADTGSDTVINPGAASKLTIATQPSATATAGIAFAQQPAVNILDAFNNLRTNDNSTVVIATRSAGAGTLSGTTNVTAVAGVVSYSNLAHLLATNITVAFTSGSLTATTSSIVSVNAGSFSQLQVLFPGETAAPGTATGKTGTPTAQAAGTAFNITVRAVDAGFNLIPSITDTVSLTVSDANATLPANVALVNGVATLSVTAKTAGSMTATANDVTDGITTGTSSAVTVNAGAFAKIQLLVPGETAAPGTVAGKMGSPTAQTAGTQFSVTVNGVDANWNVVNGANGNGYTMQITSSDANATLPGTANLASGVRSFNVTLRTAGSWTLTATDTDNTALTNVSPVITVNLAPLNKLQVLLPGETAAPGSTSGKTGTPTAQVAGVPFTVTVRSVDTAWNLIDTNHTVHITASDANAVLPADAALVNGSATFSVTLKDAGSQTVTASDVTQPAITANTSASLTLGANVFTKLQLLMPGETAVPATAAGKTGTPSARTAGTSFSVTVNSVDDFWNVVSTNHNIAITSSDANATLPANNTLSGGTRSFTVTLKTAGSNTVTATDLTDVTKTASTSPLTLVNVGAFTKLQLLVPGETAAPGSATGKIGTPSSQQSNILFAVTVNSVDANWNLISTNDTIRIYSSDANAVLPANAALVAGTKSFNVTLRTIGTATVTSSNVTHNAITLNTSPAITVTKQSQTITFGSLANRNYGDASFAVSATASSGLPVNFSIVSGPATVVGSTVTITGAGVVTVRASQAGNGSFNAAPDVDQSFTVSPATLTVTANNSARIYGAVNPTFTASYAGFVNSDNSGVLSGSPALATTADTNSPAASYPITAAVGSLSSVNYIFTFVDGSLAVNPATLTVTADNQSRVYATANPTLTASYSGFANGETSSVLTGLPALSTTADASSSVGNYPITAAVGSLSAVNYTFTFVDGTLAVTKATLTVTANNATRSAGQSNPAFTASYSGFLNGDTSAVISGSPEITSIADTNSAAGSYLIVATNGTLSAANYDFAFVNGTLTVLSADTLFTDNFTRDTDPGSLAPWQVNSGLWTITGGELLGGPNSSSTYGFAYVPTNWVNYSVEAKLRIPAEAFGAGLGGRLDANTGAHYAAWVYPENSIGGSNVLRLIRFSDWLNWTQLQQVNLAEVGTNAHTIKLTMVGNQITVDFDANQVINTTDSTFTSGGITADGWTDAAPYVLGVDDVQVIAIKQNQTITFDALANKTYGDATFSVSATASSSLPVNFSILSGPATISGNDITITGAGSVTVRASQAGNASYNAAAAVDQSFTIAPAIVTGSITAGSKVYDGNVTATIATRSLTGVIGLDDVTLTGGSANFDDKNVGVGKTVLATGLSLAGDQAANYTLAASSATTTADITAVALTGSITVNSKVYDANASAAIATRSLVGVIGSEDVSLAGGSASFADKNVGSGKTASATGLSLIGTDVANYTLTSSSASTTADIVARPLTVSATAQSKVYNGSAVAAVNLSDDRIGSDVLTVGFTSALFDDRNVGVAKPVTVSGLDLSGDDAGNYSLVATTASSSADITAASLTGSITANNKTYDGNTNATIATRSLTGVIGLDDVTLVGGTASFDDKNIGTGKPVYATGLSLSGLDSANYTLASSAATTAADITVRTLIISATAQNKIYDGNATATVSLSDDRINGDDLTVSNTSAEFDSKDVGVAKPVSVVGISMVGVGAGNYLLASTTTSTSADITTVSLIGSIAANNKIYDGNASAIISNRSLDGVLGSDDVSLTGGSASFDNKNVGNGKTVSATGLALSGADAINYTLASSSATTTADITAASLTGSITASSKVYDGNASAAIATHSLAGVIGSDDVSLVGGTASFADKNVGVGKTVSAVGLSLVGVDAGNYTLVSVSATTTADIAARALAVSATAQNKVYDGAATAIVSLSDDRIGGDVITVSETVASFDNKNVGVAKPVSVLGLSISGADASNYTLANTTALSSADITARSLVVSAATANKVYDGNTDAIVTLSDDHVTGDDIAVSRTTATFANKNVGTGKPVSISGISMSGVDVSNYSLASTTAPSSADITARALTITATAQSKVYDGNTNAIVSLADNRVSGDVLTATNTDAGFEDANVGTAKNVNVLGLSISGVDAGNYLLANASTIATADITSVQLTVTADNKSRAYGVANPALTATLAGFVNSEDSSAVSGSAELTTLAETSSAIGSYTITASLGTLSATNYTFNFVDGSLTITPFALTVTADNQSRTYGAANPTLTGSLSGLQNGDNISATYATSADTNSPIGSYPITVSVADPDGKLVNYSVTTNEGSLTVGAALLTVTANNQTRFYGAANPTLDSIITGFVNGENASVVIGSAAISTLADAASAVGNYPITATLGTLSTANYVFGFVDGSLTITAASLTPTVTVDNKVYDGAAAAAIATRSLAGVIGSDDVSLQGGLASFADKNVGATKSVSVTGLNLTGVAAGNYSLASTSANATADITPAPVAANVTVQNKVYDGTTGAVIAGNSLAGVIAPDDVTLATAAANFTDKNVGDGKTVVVTSLTLGGADADNYALISSDVTAQADILAATLNGSIIAANKTYDGNAAATIETRSLDNVIGSDEVTLVGGVATFADKNVGSSKTVSATGLGLSGADAGNYNLVSVNSSTTADITVRSLTVTATAQSKVYDGNTTATVALADDRISGDLLTFSHTGASFDNKNVGTAKPVNVSGLSVGGTDAGNYSLANSTPSSSADITAASLTGSIGANSKVYDGNTSAVIATRTLTGVVGSDDVTLVGGTASFADKNVGIAKAVSATGLTLSGANVANYTLASGNAATTADITAASLTANATVSNKVYDGNASATIATRSLSGVVAPDDVVLVGGSATFNNKNVGSGKPVAVTGMVLAGVDMANYSLASSEANATADITAASLTGSITVMSKAYDGNNSAIISSRSLAGLIGSDDVSLSGGTATFNNKNVGAAKTVTVSGLSLVGADLANYALVSNSASTTADITAIALSVTADDQSRNYGEANPALTGTLTGVIAGDNITASYSTTATIASAAGAYPIAVLLNDPDNNLGNYIVTASNGTLTILSLTPSTIGSIEKLADGNMHIVVSGTPGHVYHLQAIGDLSSSNWSSISTNTANGLGVVEFDDLSATNHLSRFYRVSTP